MTAAVALPPDALARVLHKRPAREVPEDEIAAALERTGGNVLAASRDLGVHRTSLVRILRRAARPAAAPRVSKRQLVRVLALEACDAPPLRGRPVVGKGTGSGCVRGVRGELADFEVTERTIRNVAVDMPVQTVNAYKEHWAQRLKRRAKIRRVIGEALGAPEWTPPALPEGWRWLVTFTRYAHLRLDDDNLVASFKTHQDAVCTVLGLDDRDKRVTFRRFQAKWSEKTLVKRWNRVTKRTEIRPGFRCFFRVRIEQVKVETPS
jgi:hypothetical protein